MTHRDRAGDASGQRAGRREAAGDAGHRQGFPTPSGGSPARPERRFPKAFGLPIALRRGAWLPMSRIATPRAPGRKPWEAVSMGHYQRSLVLVEQHARVRHFNTSVLVDRSGKIVGKYRKVHLSGHREHEHREHGPR